MFDKKVPNGFILEPYVNQCCETSGMDSIEFAREVNKDPVWFQNYPYDISYIYNSRGFRDQEWPQSVEDLKNSIWCVGDSFTVGIGVEYQHIWPQLLEKKLNRRTINVSLNGASNEWIRDRTVDIIEELTPQDLIIHWSYAHRRQLDLIVEGGYKQVHYNNTTEQEDQELIIKLINDVEKLKKSVNVVHSFIPFSHYNDHEIYHHCSLIPGIKIIAPLKQIDWGRDKHHYGKATAENFVEDIIKIGSVHERFK